MVRRQRYDLCTMGDREFFIQNYQPTVGLASLSGDDGFKPGLVANWCGERHYPEGRTGSFEGAHIILRIGCRRRVKHKGDTAHARCDLLEQFHPLGTKRALDSGETSGVTTRPRQARHKTAA